MMQQLVKQKNSCRMKQALFVVLVTPWPFGNTHIKERCSCLNLSNSSRLSTQVWFFRCYSNKASPITLRPHANDHLKSKPLWFGGALTRLLSLLKNCPVQKALNTPKVPYFRSRSTHFPFSPSQCKELEERFRLF